MWPFPAEYSAQLEIKGEFLVYEALNIGKQTHRLPWRQTDAQVTLEKIAVGNEEGSAWF